MTRSINAEPSGPPSARPVSKRDTPATLSSLTAPALLEGPSGPSATFRMWHPEHRGIEFRVERSNGGQASVQVHHSDLAAWSPRHNRQLPKLTRGEVETLRQRIGEEKGADAQAIGRVLDRALRDMKPGKKAGAPRSLEVLYSAVESTMAQYRQSGVTSAGSLDSSFDRGSTTPAWPFPGSEPRRSDYPDPLHLPDDVQWSPLQGHYVRNRTPVTVGSLPEKTRTNPDGSVEYYSTVRQTWLPKDGTPPDF